MNSRLVLSWQCGIPESVDIAQQFRQAFQGKGGVMLGYNRSYNAIEIECRIIFNRSLLYGVAHNFGQMLAYTSGNIMHTFIINVSDQSRAM
ncbi:hypothetical protein HRN72_001880 [Salmonella enterica]|nr:hypothetical protein [Salmonella enterica]EGR8142303.1 hypothetical protein [Salmonella enterica subsp. enterica serovar Offa]EFQ6140167.1 hypothetical protein [Salmonella enterica]EFT1843975.1 hypothetical protein [Salmonella enterica]EFV0428410.1 hypothetical protein [Salmonella enterica]